MTRALCLIALLGAAALLSACGGDASKPAAPPGSPENPLVGKTAETSSTARSNEATGKADERLDYEKLVERQSNKPGTRFTPCNLVTRAEAKAILNTPVQALLEAPQGPTCIYRSKTDKTFITVAVQPLGLDRIKKQMRRPQPVAVSNRDAYCGSQGQPVLNVSLSRNRVLSISAPCAVAKRFAARAVPRFAG
jgi:hypothetical protein